MIKQLIASIALIMTVEFIIFYNDTSTWYCALFGGLCAAITAQVMSWKK